VVHRTTRSPYVTSKWYKAVELDPSITSDDFSVLVPIYGNVKYLQNADYLRPYGRGVVRAC